MKRGIPMTFVLVYLRPSGIPKIQILALYQNFILNLNNMLYNAKILLEGYTLHFSQCESTISMKHKRTDSLAKSESNRSITNVTISLLDTSRSWETTCSFHLSRGCAKPTS